MAVVVVILPIAVSNKFQPGSGQSTPTGVWIDTTLAMVVIVTILSSRLGELGTELN
jgi:hypothetical protein